MSNTSDMPGSAPVPPAAPDTSVAPGPALSFTPVRCRPRHDGWTPERQIAFIEVLAQSGSVARACARVGLSPRSAYNLRLRPDARDFCLAWDAARDQAFSRRTASYRAIRDAVAGSPRGPLDNLLHRSGSRKEGAQPRDPTL